MYGAPFAPYIWSKLIGSQQVMGNLQTAATTHLNAGSIKKRSINSLFAHDRIQFLIIDTQGANLILSAFDYNNGSSKLYD